VEKGTKKKREGTVVSAKMEKTVVVSIERRFPHPKYTRVVKRTRRVKAHVDEVSCKVGDKVRIVETRPISKDKRWRVIDVIT